MRFSTHVDDVARLLYFEDLSEMILVGWSYGGAVVDAVADLAPERVRLIVNLDGPVSQEGRSVLDCMLDGRSDEMRAATLSEISDGWWSPPTAEDMAEYLPDAASCEWDALRERPQPINTVLDPYPRNDGRRHGIPHAYIRCSGSQRPENPNVTPLRADSAWTFIEIPHHHFAILTAPDTVAACLEQLVMGEVDEPGA